MKKGLFPIILLAFISCKSFKFDDRMIPFTYLVPDNEEIKIGGDYEILDFFNNEKIRVMCYYFRDWEYSPRSIIVSIVLNKKYAFKSYGQVMSKEFGLIPLSENSPIRQDAEWEDLRYILSLENMDMAERKDRVLRDTIWIGFGEKRFTYVPRSRFK